MKGQQVRADAEIEGSGGVRRRTLTFWGSDDVAEEQSSNLSI